MKLWMQKQTLTKLNFENVNGRYSHNIIIGKGNIGDPIILF